MFNDNLRTPHSLNPDTLFAKYRPDEAKSFEERFSRADLEHQKSQMKIFNKYKTMQAHLLHQKYRPILFCQEIKPLLRYAADYAVKKKSLRKRINSTLVHPVSKETIKSSIESIVGLSYALLITQDIHTSLAEWCKINNPLTFMCLLSPHGPF